MILGASLLKGAAHAPSSGDRGVSTRAALAAGAAAAFVSTLASARALRRGTRDGRSLWPYALYRCLLAALIVHRPPLRRAQ